MTFGCLSLNASYEPIQVLPLKKIVKAVMKGTVEILEVDENRTIRYGNGTMPFPTVVKLKKMVKIPVRMRSRVTNTFLFARDNYTCQYCGKTDKELGSRISLTRDHIYPKSRGGEDSWTNCVAACDRCNTRKANKTPQEAGMKLKRKPGVPHMVYLKWKIRKLTPMQVKYVTLFYGENWMLYVD